MIRRYLSLVTVATALAAGGSAIADEAERLQGLFCNTEAQIDLALAAISAGASPRHAADHANREAVVCTYVDRIQYLIVRPVAVGDTVLPLVKYRGALVGVLVGDAVRPVTPEAQIYFVTPPEIADSGVERRT